ncbi:hypothetical protein T440DRAFT_154717 [Plenodomus tracheiphilus IPT5]|uniref:Uncharacterized protein n=1 Tax=Plenodomus tracheiphilus IPT5 TaxID=1408161 RepID=A0A6A7BIU5_9PLEO|nr:hypothetical protein T440DRAFT_154717 [Plenodomus tracheiphilus IPT5]
MQQHWAMQLGAYVRGEGGGRWVGRGRRAQGSVRPGDKRLRYGGWAGARRRRLRGRGRGAGGEGRARALGGRRGRRGGQARLVHCTLHTAHCTLHTACCRGGGRARARAHTAVVWSGYGAVLCDDHGEALTESGDGRWDCMHESELAGGVAAGGGSLQRVQSRRAGAVSRAHGQCRCRCRRHLGRWTTRTRRANGSARQMGASALTRAELGS